MSRSTPPTTPCSSSSSSLATSTPPFSTTSPARLQALYSDFSRQKQSNPTSYHANVDWWKKALEALVSSGKQEREVVRDGGGDGGHDDDDLPMKSERLVLHAGRDLIERLKIPKVGKPLALGAVLVRFFFSLLFPSSVSYHYFIFLIHPLIPASLNSNMSTAAFFPFTSL